MIYSHGRRAYGVFPIAHLVGLKESADATDYAENDPNQSGAAHHTAVLENNEELYAYAQFIGEPTAYVLNALIEKLSSDKDYREWRAKNSGSFVPALGAAKRRNTASYQARTSAGRAGMVTLPQGV